MKELQRITTQYIEREDRLRLSGSLQGEVTVVLWLTQRLLLRLLPPLFRWLDTHQPAAVPRPEVLHSLAQQRAQAQRQSAAPEVAVQAQPSSQSWLVTSIQVTSTDQAVRLTFKGAQPQEAVFVSMTPVLLRQWLAIVYTGYCTGQWPKDCWPQWMLEQDPAPAPMVPSSTLLH